MGDVFFPAKTRGAVSAIASLGINSDMIYKHRPPLGGEMGECKALLAGDVPQHLHFRREVLV